MIAYAFIFARGGSKGLPRKNIKPLAGKPLICYSIETAKAVDCIEKVFVSTDDAEIAEVARQAGAEVIVRPDELAGDKAPEWLAWQHAIRWVQDKYGQFSDFVSLPATSPLRAPIDVIQAIEKRNQMNADMCLSVAEASRSPYFNMVKFVEDEVELVIKPEGQVVRRQDAPQVFDITTVVYASTPEFILNHMGLFSGKVTAVTVPKHRAVDIDDIYDFYFAETLLKYRELADEK